MSFSKVTDAWPANKSENALLPKTITKAFDKTEVIVCPTVECRGHFIVIVIIKTINDNYTIYLLLYHSGTE